MTPTVRSRLQTSVALAAVLAQLAASAAPASAFCGFYVAKADAKMFNKSSKVVLTRNGQETAITMASDYEGEPSEFALVVPVPTFIKREQISVVDSRIVDHLDAYTAPRLVEYFDPDPCEARIMALAMSNIPVPTTAMPRPPAPQYRGVKVEARYDIAEYDVSILSAEDSDGLIRWLTDNGYKIPGGGWLSSAEDMARFEVAILNDKLIKRATRDLMWTPLKPLDGSKDEYGLGWGNGSEGDLATVGHTGGQQGTSTAFLLAPQQRDGVVVLANMEGVGARDLAVEILKVVVGTTGNAPQK